MSFNRFAVRSIRLALWNQKEKKLINWLNFWWIQNISIIVSFASDFQSW